MRLRDEEGAAPAREPPRSCGVLEAGELALPLPLCVSSQRSHTQAFGSAVSLSSLFLPLSLWPLQ